jgi:serine/threonine protein kinase
VALLRGVFHPNILSIYGFSTDGSHHCIVLELCHGGALDTRLQCKLPPMGQRPRPPVGWRHRIRIAVEVGRALVYLHSLHPPTIHRDVKTANVLLDAEGTAKLADFGTAYQGAGVIDPSVRSPDTIHIAPGGGDSDRVMARTNEKHSVAGSVAGTRG